MRAAAILEVVSLAIATGATSPVPSAANHGIAYSTITSAIMAWDGASWQPVAGSNTGAITNATPLITASPYQDFAGGSLADLNADRVVFELPAWTNCVELITNGAYDGVVYLEHGADAAGPWQTLILGAGQSLDASFVPQVIGGGTVANGNSVIKQHTVIGSGIGGYRYIRARPGYGDNGAGGSIPWAGSCTVSLRALANNGEVSIRGGKIAIDTRLAPVQIAGNVVATVAELTGSNAGFINSMTDDEGTGQHNTTFLSIIQGRGHLSFDVLGTFTGSLIVEGRISGYGGYQQLPTIALGDATPTFNPITAPGRYKVVDSGAWIDMRARALTFTSGEADLYAHESSGLSDAEVRALNAAEGFQTAVISVVNANLLTGTPTPGSFIQLGPLNGGAQISLQVQNARTGGILSGYVSNDGVKWIAQTQNVFINIVGGAASPTIAAATVGFFNWNPQGFRYARLAASSAITGGTSSQVVANVTSAPALPVGQTQTISGAVTTTGTTTASLATPTTNFITSAASLNLTSVKASAATLYGGFASNTGSTTQYVKLYNKASAPVVASDVPVMTIAVAAGQSVPIVLGELGARFATGLAVAITAAAADTDATNATAGILKLNLNYV